MVLIKGGLRIVVFLLAYRLVGHQFPHAIGLQPDRRQIGFGPAEGGPGIVMDGLKVSGVDLKEDLTGFDIGAFGKQALLDDATHLRTHFRDEIGGRPAGQFRRDHQLLWLYRHYGNFGWPARWCFIGRLSATGQKQKTGKQPGGGD